MLANNFFGNNVKFLRTRRKMTQEVLAKELFVTRSKLNCIEIGQTKSPSVDDLLKFSDYFKITIDTLIKVDLSTLGELKLRELENGSDVYIKGGKLRVLSITVDSKNNENVEYVPIKAKMGYAANHSDPEYIEKLPKYSLPNIPREGTYRIFPATGDSMLPITDGSEITARFIHDWTTIPPKTPCIIILNGQQDFVFKLVTFLGGAEFELVSLNPIYAPYSVKGTEILEIWEFHSFTSREIPQSSDLDIILQEIRKLRG